MDDVREIGDVAGREPDSRLGAQTDSRRRILASYWIVVLLALPLWWTTTSIERLSLPESRVLSQSTKKLKLPVDLVFEAPPSHRALLPLIHADVVTRTNQHPSVWDHLDLKISDFGEGAQRESATTYNVQLGSCGFSCKDGAVTSRISGRNVSFDLPSQEPEQFTSEIGRTIEALLVPVPPSVQAQYSPRYRLAFSLLNEDASVGGAGIAWDVQGAINSYLSQTILDLSVVHNFTVESQVQYHAPLAFELSSPVVNQESGSKFFDLDQDHLKVFINSAEWTLASSVSNDIVLHFILFIPSIDHRPLRVTRANGTPSSANAFIIPQWGGVVILNPLAQSGPSTTNYHLSSTDLASTFSTFRSQLQALLGVPPLPPSLSKSVPNNAPLSPWQLDGLARRRALENTKGSEETLSSIIKLVNQISNMPVRSDVRNDILAALDALDNVHRTDKTLAISSILGYSSEALTRASRAFFNPGMLAMLYFPAEHKAAVLTPLFAPVSVPLIVVTLKELKAWRKARKEKREAARDEGLKEKAD